MIKDLLAKVADGQHLTRAEARTAMQDIMSGEASPAQIGGFLLALRVKGEQAEELIGFANVMRAHALAVPHELPAVIDTCGTGGDGSGTLNISTAAALVAAAAGATVAKHGNRSVSSCCGSADLLEQWGVKINLDVERATAALHEHNLTFLFAPGYHPAMKHAAGPRRELGVRTVFNLLGPITNPAGVKRQVLGVFDRKWTVPLAETLRELGSVHALVVASHDGLDEISPAATTQVTELRDGTIRTYTIEPEELGLRRQSLDSIRGGDAKTNAARLESILKGAADPAADAVAANAGAALYVAGVADSWPAGTRSAQEAIAAGAPWQKLSRWAEWTRRQG